MNKARKAIAALVCITAGSIAAVPAGAGLLINLDPEIPKTHEMVRKNKLALSVHGADAAGVALEYGIMERVTAGYGSGDGIFLKGFLLARELDIYLQVSTGGPALLRAGMEMNVNSVFFGIEIASLTAADNAGIVFRFSRAFIGAKF